MQVCGSCAEDVQEPEDAPEGSAAGARGAGARERGAGICPAAGLLLLLGSAVAGWGKRKHSPILLGTKHDIPVQGLDQFNFRQFRSRYSIPVRVVQKKKKESEPAPGPLPAQEWSCTL